MSISRVAALYCWCIDKIWVLFASENWISCFYSEIIKNMKKYSKKKLNVYCFDIVCTWNENFQLKYYFFFKFLFFLKMWFSFFFCFILLGDFKIEYNETKSAKRDIWVRAKWMDYIYWILYIYMLWRQGFFSIFSPRFIFIYFFEYMFFFCYR